MKALYTFTRPGDPGTAGVAAEEDARHGAVELHAFRDLERVDRAVLVGRAEREQLADGWVGACDALKLGNYLVEVAVADRLQPGGPPDALLKRLPVGEYDGPCEALGTQALDLVRPDRRGDPRSGDIPDIDPHIGDPLDLPRLSGVDGYDSEIPCCPDGRGQHEYQRGGNSQANMHRTSSLGGSIGLSFMIRQDAVADDVWVRRFRETGFPGGRKKGKSIFRLPSFHKLCLTSVTLLSAPSQEHSRGRDQS